MQTEFPTTDIVQFSWYTVFNTGPECNGSLNYFHYTNSDNLAFILKEDCIDLRLSRADCFADKQEMLHIVPIFEDVLEELLQKGDIDIEFHRMIKSCISDAKLLIVDFRKFYVFCLSANGNSAYLKENYACRDGKDGVIIGIQGLALEDIQFTSEGNPVDGIDLYDVIYDSEELKNGFSRILKQLYNMRDRDTDLSLVTKRVINALCTYGLAYKPLPFVHEEETRMIVDISRLTLAKERFYQDDDRYLHILLPTESLYNIIKITKKR